MCDVPVFYATTEGHTARIAEHLAQQLRQCGLDSRAISVASPEAAHIQWDRVSGAILGASLHVGKHQKEAIEFARRRRRELSAVPSLFVSVSLAAGSKSPESVHAAQEIAEKFCMSTEWQPLRIASVAGCLAYTKYNWLVRLFMRRIAKKEGGSTDATRDHVYTDWKMVEELADTLAHEIHRRQGPRSQEPMRAAG